MPPVTMDMPLNFLFMKGIHTQPLNRAIKSISIAVLLHMVITVTQVHSVYQKLCIHFTLKKYAFFYI